MRPVNLSSPPTQFASSSWKKSSLARVILLLFVFSEVIWNSLAKQIKPYGRKPIELTVNNANEISSYIFQFITQTDLLIGDGILIKFPIQFTIDTTLLTGTYVSGLTFNLETSAWESLSGDLNISYSSSTGFLIIVPDMKAGIYKIQIDKIRNPATQIGTGMFSISTRRFAASKLDYNLLDDNNSFGQVGIIAAAPLTITIGSVVISNTQINAIATYTITFTTSILTPVGGFIIVTFKNTKITFLSDSVFTCPAIPTATFVKSSDQELMIKGFTADIPIGTSAVLTITRVLNPPSKGFTNSLLIQTWLNGAYTILEQKTFDIETLIMYGGFTSVQQKAFSLLFPNAPTYPLVLGETVQHELTFITSNAIPLGGQIVVSYFLAPPATPTMFSIRVITGLQDVSSTAPVTIVVSGTDIVIQQFQAISGQKLIKIAFEVSHGATTPLTTFAIKSYYTTATTYLIDKLDSTITPQSLAIGTTALTGSSTVAFSNQVYQSVNLVTITIADSLTSSNSLWVWFPTGFVINRSNCKITSPSVYNCDTVIIAGKENLAIISPAAAVSGTITISISVTNNINPYGYYPIGVSIVVAATSVVSRHSTLYYIPGGAISPGIIYRSAGFSVGQLSLDCQQYSMMKFFFTVSDDIPQSQWLADYTQPTSRILLKFPYLDATPMVAFSPDLGISSVYSTSNFPCYGILGIQPFTSSDDLLCQMLTDYNTINASNPTIIVQVTNYKAVLAGTTIELHFPNFKNPSATLATIPIVIEIYRTILRQEYLVYKQSYSLPICNPSTASQNPKNPYNPAPIFNPSYVNYASTTSVFYTPGTNKGLTSGDFIVFIFPQLQVTVPMQYILPKTGLKCYIGVGSTTAIPCRTYPKAGWVLFFVNSVITQLVEYTFYFTGITNPTFASDFQSTMSTINIRSSMIIETGVFTTFKAFTAGALVSGKITTEYFESLRINVNYDFLFSFQNNIPDNGNIDLIFPPNFFDLYRSTTADPDIPLAQIEIFFGLESYDSYPLTHSSHQQISVNIFTIKGVKAVPKKTLIYLRMKQIRNPPKSGITNYFGIKSKNQEDLTIDYERSVRFLTILRKLPTGIINFNYFSVSPDNGNPTTAASNEVSNFPGTYTVSFYPNYDIPPLGFIYLQFPNDFGANYFLDAPDIRCNVSGAIITYKSCTLDSSGSAVIVIIKLDDYLYVVDGMKPVVISIPHIKNIGPELNTGVVVVKTIYDEVVLDESGTSVTNRKAATGVSAKILNVQNFDYYPQNEGQAASYTVEIFPIMNFDDNTWILFEFSYDYSRELGESIECQSADLQKSVNSPIECIVGNWQIQMRNLKNITPSATTTVSISLLGIINPTSGTLPVIKCFIMTTETHAYSYQDNIATSTATIAAPDILFMRDLTIGSSNTRTLCDYQFFLKIGGAATFDITKLSFQAGYDLYNLWVSQQLSFSPAGASLMTIAPTGNNVGISYATTTTVGQQIVILMKDVPNPYDEGLQPGYPTVSLYSSTLKKMVQQTFNNLNNFLTPSFTHNGPLIIVNNDDPIIYIEAGVWSSEIPVTIQTAQATDLVIVPIISATFSTQIKFTEIKILAGQTSTTFQIGVSYLIAISQLFIQWDKSGAPATFINVRPVTIKFQRLKNIKITVDTIDTVPSGGRSSPIKVLLDNAPFDNLYFNVRILGTIPAYLTVYPTQLTFSKTVLFDYFWVSVGPYTQGTSGKTVFFLTADGTKAQQLVLISTFQLSPRQQTFVISKPDSTAPLVYSLSHTINSSGFLFQIQVSSPSTIYIYAALKDSPRISLPELKAKKYPTSYFASPFIMTEYTAKDDLNNYSFTVSGLPSGFDFIAYIYVEDYNGNQSEDELSFSGTTLGGTPNGSVSLSQASLLWLNDESVTSMGQVSATYAYISQIGLQFPGHVYAIVLANPLYKYPNLDTAISGSVRYLATAQHTCTLQTLNTLSIACALNGVNRPDPSRSDFLSYSKPGKPTAYQIYQGFDENNLFSTVVASASFPADIPWVLKLSGLQASTSYIVYYVGVFKENGNYLFMSDSKIRSITFTTADAELVESKGKILLGISWVLLVLCALLW